MKGSSFLGGRGLGSTPSAARTRRPGAGPALGPPALSARSQRVGIWFQRRQKYSESSASGLLPLPFVSGPCAVDPCLCVRRDGPRLRGGVTLPGLGSRGSHGVAACHAAWRGPQCPVAGGLAACWVLRGTVLPSRLGALAPRIRGSPMLEQTSLPPAAPSQPPPGHAQERQPFGASRLQGTAVTPGPCGRGSLSTPSLRLSVPGAQGPSGHSLL